MGVGVSIPSLKPNAQSRDLIVSVLAYEFPLSINKIYNLIKKNYASRVTYQAVHKIIRQMLSDGTLIKKGKEYMLSKDWISTLSEFVNLIDHNYSIGSKTNIKAIQDLSTGRMQVLTFDSYMEAENFKKKIEEEYVRNSNKNSPPICVHEHNLKRPIIYSGELMNHLSNFTTSGVEVFHLCESTTLIDKWCADFYSKSLSFNCKFGIPCPNGFEFYILGDRTIELHAPNSLWEDISKAYSEAGHISKLDVIEFYKDVLLKKREIQVVMYENKEISEGLRNNIMKYFIKKRTKVKFMIFDVNGVLIPENSIYEVCRGHKNYNKIKDLIITQTLGKISMAKSFIEIGKLIDGITLKEVVDYAKDVKFMPGMMTLARAIKNSKIKAMIITTGFRPVMNIINQRTGGIFEPIICNDLVFEKNNKKLSNREVDKAIKRNDPNELSQIKTMAKINLVIDQPDRKTEFIEKELARHGVAIKDTAAVGDSMGDSAMIAMCATNGGIGISFNPNTPLIEYSHMLMEKNANIELIEQKNLAKILDVI